MISHIAGEKQCESCGCLFVNKADDKATKCKACTEGGIDKAGPNEKFIYQDVKRTDLEAKLNQVLAKIEAVLKILKRDEKTREYSHKCDTCGQVFVSESPNAKYCESCKQAAN